MLVLLTAIVFSRFILGQGMSFAGELDRFAFGWMVYIGAAYTAQMGGSIRLEAVIRMFPKGFAWIAGFAAEFLWICFNLLIIC